MSNKQLLKEQSVEITINGMGDTLTKAIANIFNQVSNNIYRTVELPVIQMETKEVYFEKVIKQSKQFLMREKTHYSVVAKLIINVKYLEIEENDYGN